MISKLTESQQQQFDAWLSLVERCVRDAEVASSNLVASTKNRIPKGVRFFVDPIIIVLATSIGANATFGSRGCGRPVDDPREARSTDRAARSGGETAGSNPVASP